MERLGKDKKIMPLHDRILKHLSVACILIGIVIAIKTFVAFADLNRLQVAIGCLFALIAMVGGLGVYTWVREGR